MLPKRSELSLREHHGNQTSQKGVKKKLCQKNVVSKKLRVNRHLYRVMRISVCVCGGGGG